MVQKKISRSITKLGQPGIQPGQAIGAKPAAKIAGIHAVEQDQGAGSCVFDRLGKTPVIGEGSRKDRPDRRPVIMVADGQAPRQVEASHSVPSPR